jgi:TM2 domain-containing membrane protein YozV
VYCKQCGIKIPEGTKFCPECGANQSNVSEPKPNQPILNGVEQKSRLVAGLLGIFIGTLGIHNFYLGYNKNGIIQILLTTLGSFILIGPFISWIWSLIEAINIFTGGIKVDANGIPLKE